MNYFSKKGGEIKGGVFAAFEYGHYVDEEELIDLQWWLAEALGLDEGPVDVCGEMECPIYLSEDGYWFIWKAQYGWRRIESLLAQWRQEEKEWEKECEK